MANVSVRGQIRLIQVEVRDTPDLQPDRAAELLNKLSALLGNVSDEIREADAAFAAVLLKHLESEEAANRAKIRAETTPEYLRKREARDLRELAIELIRSLKYFLQAKRDEWRYAGQQ
jgi:hypothetical protein